jgi:hypothetical protein
MNNLKVVNTCRDCSVEIDGSLFICDTCYRKRKPNNDLP